MLENPELEDEKLIACLRDEYGLKVTEITFLPLGADRHTAVYRAEAEEAYFVKLRSGDFDETTVTVPKLLHDQGVRQIIAPLHTNAGRLWAQIDAFHVMVSPFVQGYHGFAIDLSARHWHEIGRALRGIHAVVLPPVLAMTLPRETYSPHWREVVRGFQRQVATTIFEEPIAAALATFLKSKANEINELLKYADRLSGTLQQQALPFALCHADIHVGNVLVDQSDNLYIVDWDTVMLAPKERDLMFFGAGMGGRTFSAAEEARLFYEGYGQVEIDLAALAYYRCERIVQDIAVYGEQLLLTDAGSADRAEGLRQLIGQFQPSQVVEIALQTARRLPAGAA